MNECINYWFKRCTSDVLHQALPGTLCDSLISSFLYWYKTFNATTWLLCSHDSSRVTVSPGTLILSSFSLSCPQPQELQLSRFNTPAGLLHKLVSYLSPPQCEVKITTPLSFGKRKADGHMLSSHWLRTGRKMWQPTKCITWTSLIKCLGNSVLLVGTWY